MWQKCEERLGLPIVRPYPWRVIPAVDRGLTIARGPIGTRRASRRMSNVEGIPEWPTGRIRATDDARLAGKTITFPRAFYFVRRHCLESESPAAPAPWRGSGANDLSPQSAKARQGGQRMAYRSKRRPARRAGSKTGRGESISSAGDSDENRPKSVCTFDFGGPKRLQCLRAVGLRPDSIVIRMRPYVLPLKGKGPKKIQLPKEVHKVHTALCMCSQPY